MRDDTKVTIIAIIAVAIVVATIAVSIAVCAKSSNMYKGRLKEAKVEMCKGVDNVELCLVSIK